MTPYDDPNELAAHLRDDGTLAENEPPYGNPCGIDADDDQGSCLEVMQYRCDGCGLPVCGFHAWLGTDGATQHGIVCAVCYGIAGYVRRPGFAR